MTIRAIAAGVVASLLLGAPLAHAQEHKGTAAGADMSGLWILQDPGSGSWTEWFDNVPKPQLRPDIIADNQRMAANEAAGNVVNRAPRTAACPIGNLPMMMASSPPINIVVSRDEVLIGSESNRGRFVYTDRRPHRDVKAPSYVPTGFGDSIGHWEGDTLVVDTIGFAPRVCDSRRPVMLVPGGGRAKDTTHLVERYRLAGPDELSVTFTWEDPTVFLAPHTYSYTYKRLPEGIPIENNEEPATAQPDRQYTTTKAEK